MASSGRIEISKFSSMWWMLVAVVRGAVTRCTALRGLALETPHSIINSLQDLFEKS
jgi:hypothetical protein